MTLSEELQWRGFYNQTTFQAPELLDTTRFTLYLGTDPTGDSLHVGHLAVYMMARRFADHGHKVFLLVGGGTGMIGDPSGKSEERNLLTLDQVAYNKQALAGQVRALFGGQKFELVDNYDWLKDVSLLEFLRDTGKYFGMSTLVQRDYISDRIGEGGSGMSYTEFSYTLLQGYDYWHLFKHHGLNLQIGGSDQWGNIISGVELIRRKEAAEVHGMTAPLVINKATGKKFGKSEGGAVWLDEKKTSVYAFYQFWLNADDESVMEYLKLFTLLSPQDVANIEKHFHAEPHKRFAQRRLAEEMTNLVHGAERMKHVQRVTEVLFGGADVANLNKQEMAMLAKEIPTAERGVSLIDAMVVTGLAASNGEARRLLAGGGVSVNGEKTLKDIRIDEAALVKKGKNGFALVR